MRLVRVEEIPENHVHTPKKDIREMLDQFMHSDMKYAQVVLDEGDYARVETARQTLVLARNRYGYRLDVKTRAGELYLAKKED